MNIMNIETIQKAQVFSLQKVSCKGCVKTIQKVLDNLSGVSSAVVNFEKRQVTVHGDVSEQQIVQAIEAVGYGAAKIN